MDFFWPKFLPTKKSGFKQISLKIFFKNAFNKEIKFEHIRLEKKIICMKKKKKRTLNVPKKYLNFRKNAFAKNFSLGRDFESFLNSIGNFFSRTEKNIPFSNKNVKGKIKVLLLVKNWAKNFENFSAQQKIEFLILVSFFSLDKNFEIRHKSKKIVLKLVKKCGLATIFPLLRNDLGNKREGVRKLVIHILKLIITNLKLSKYLPFIRALFYKTKSWRTRFSICQILQSEIKNSVHLDSFEFLEIVSLIERVLNEKKKKTPGSRSEFVIKIM